MAGAAAHVDADRPSRAAAMLRLARTPRWLLLLGLLIALIVGATLLGRWQWERTQDILAAERAAAAEPIPVEQALEGAAEELPSESIGRPVTAVGRYDVARQVAVPNRSLDGNPGSWIVTGMRLADGSLVPVLRGWVAADDAASTVVPEGEVTISGVLQPDEIFYADAPVTPDSVAAISRESLGQAWGEDVPPGFIVLAEQTPPSDSAPQPVPPTVQTADVPFPLQNFFYAFQWWIFASFGVFLYLRWLWIEAGRKPDVD